MDRLGLVAAQATVHSWKRSRKKAPGEFTWRPFLACHLERVMGIEPTLFAWEARVLPLNDTRVRPF
jgi:hypothetical protein